MPIPTNAKPGDFFLVSFDGKNPHIDPNNLNHWFMHGGLIRIGQWLNGDGFGEYEHAAIYAGSNRVIEAQSTGVTLANGARYEHPDTLWSTGIIKLTDIQREKIIDAAMGYIGTLYSWLDYGALAAKRLHLGPLVPGLKNYVASTKHMICSQLVDQCYQDAGVHLFNDGRWPGYVTPGSLRNMLLSKR